MSNDRKTSNDQSTSDERQTSDDRNTSGDRKPDPIAAFHTLMSNDSVTNVFVHHIAQRIERNARAHRYQALGIAVPVVLFILGSIGVFMFDQLVKTTTEAVTADVTRTLTKSLSERIDAGQKTLKETLNASMEERIDKKFEEVNADIEEVKSTVNGETNYLQFALSALALNVSTSFKMSERDAVIAQLERIATSESLTARSEFPDLLEKVVDALAAANQREAIVVIDDLFNGPIEEHPGMTFTLVSHFGERLLGNPLPPARWSEDDIGRFDRYAKAARLGGIPEEALARQILIEFLKADSRKTEIVTEFLKELSTYNPQQKGDFLINVVRYSDPAFWIALDSIQPDHQRIATLALLFIEHYQDELQQYAGDPDVWAYLGQRHDQYRQLGRYELAEAIATLYLNIDMSRL